MPELDQPSQELLGHFERITAFGEPVTAAEHPAFQELHEMGLGNIDPDTVVARRRTIHENDTDTLRSRTVIESLTPEAMRLLSDFDENPAIGTISITHQTHIPFEIFGHINTQPSTQLQFELNTDGTITMVIGGSPPFGPELEEVTARSWQEWGCTLHYQVTERGGEYAFILNIAPQEVLVARLGEVL